ncbi:MAG: methionyl-tRNA formyltransferase [Candidatus Binatia bacterium]|nr:methionyl-tRNA formyltransferase [Candidatus Binatia bacterium]
MNLSALPAGPLRIVFLGTPDLAASVLRELRKGPDTIVGAFTKPDARKGRGLQWLAPPVKDVAEEFGIPVYQPENWRDSATLDTLRSLKPDLAITAAYGRILPQAALEIPKFGCLNVHASLLPRWRGADPIRQAILAGDAETGITIMEMVLEMDAGDALWQRKLTIADHDTLASLESRMASLGGSTLTEALKLWRAGDLRATAQDSSRVTMAPLCRKADGKIAWTDSASAIERRIRAFSPWPGATSQFAEQTLRIWQADLEETSTKAAPGELIAVDKNGLLVATGTGALRLIEIQPAGKKRMLAADWARGARLTAGMRLGS